MKRKTIGGKPYILYPDGILIPALLVQEARSKVHTPKDVMPLLQSEAHAKQEHVVLFTLDGNNQIIQKHSVTVGLVNQCQIHPREIFRPAILDAAVSILVAHNHPSGNLEASESDLVATRRLVDVSKTIGIPLLDHVIVGQSGFLSIREKYPNYFN